MRGHARRTLVAVVEYRIVLYCTNCQKANREGMTHVLQNVLANLLTSMHNVELYRYYSTCYILYANRLAVTR